MRFLYYFLCIGMLLVSCDREQLFNQYEKAYKSDNSASQIDDVKSDLDTEDQEIADITTPDISNEIDNDSEITDLDIINDDQELPDDSISDPCNLHPDNWDKGIEFQLNPEQVPYDEMNFPDTVQSGSMQSTSVYLTGYTEDNSDKTLLVWRDGDSPDYIALVHEAVITPVDGFLKTQVAELTPGTWYNYGFFQKSDGDYSSRSIIGKFRTAIHEDCMEVLTISGTHGTNWKHEYTALEITAKHDIDFFVQLGDFAYNDGAETKEEFRNFWHRTLADTEYKHLLPKVGQYQVWDDHEIEDNSKLEPNRYNDPEKVNRGYNVWFEVNPSPKFSDTDDYWHADSYWNSYKWGKTLELFTLDCRRERQHKTRGKEDIYIGLRQMEWLKKALLESKSHFKVIANSVPIVEYWGLWNVASGDRWQGYEKQRTEILDFIVENNIKNVWWLSGDFHTGSVARLNKPGHKYSSMWEINLGPGGNTNPLGKSMLGSPKGQFLYLTGDANATVVTFDPFNDSVDVKFIGTEKEDIWFETTLVEQEVPLNFFTIDEIHDSSDNNEIDKVDAETGRVVKKQGY